jgi:hypothetical protein
VYFVPFIVHDADLVALDEIEDGLFSTNLIDKVDVLFAGLVAVSVTVKTPYGLWLVVLPIVNVFVTAI